MTKDFNGEPRRAAPEREPAPRPNAAGKYPEMVAVAELLKSGRAEGKSRRMQVLVKPGTYDRLKALSQESGLSMNEIINISLETLLQSR